MATFHKHLPIPRRANVLEVGCGTGRFWAQGADVLPDDLRLVLTDRSPAMVDEARRRLAKLNRWHDFQTRVTDVTELPFADREFDVVLAMHMLYLAADRARAVEEIARVLRPKGLFILTTNGRDNLRSLFELGHAAFGGPNRDLGALTFGLEDVQAALAAHFENISVTRYGDLMRITDAVDVIGYLRSTPAGQRATPAQHNELEVLVDRAFEKGAGAIVTTRITGFATATRRGQLVEN